MRITRTLQSGRFALRAGICLTLCLWVAASVRAHVEDMFASVHFHSGAPDFGTVPRRGRVHGELDDRRLDSRYVDGMDGGRDDGIELTADGYEKALDARERVRENLLQSAEAYRKAGEWARALRTYEWVTRRFRPRGDVRDRIEVLRRVVSMPSPLPPAFTGALRLYLDGMAALDAERRPEAQRAFDALSSDRPAGFLREHALYQRASLAYEWWDFPRAITLYEQLLRAFPNTLKREAALIMIARCALLPQTAEGRQIAVGRQAVAQLEAAFPQTRFRRSILGLRARIAYLTGRYADAIGVYFALGDLESVEIVRAAMPAGAQGAVRVRLLAEYLRRLARAADYHAYRVALDDIEDTRKSLSPGDAYRFTRLLFRQPDLAAPYFYYRLYHCENAPADLTHLAQLADAFAARHPAAQLPPLIRVRLAEVYYQRRLYAKGLAWADRALSQGPFDRALFVHGAILDKLKRYHPAIRDFTLLLRRYPGSPLRRCAREELATLYEAAGDLGSALEQYFELGYQLDIAFLLDARMTIPEIERFARTRRLDMQYNERVWHYPVEEIRPSGQTRYALVACALGIRYLREEQWKQAELWLRRVPRSEYTSLNRERKENDDTASIPPDPLTAIHDLRRLQGAVTTARSAKQKAAAMYRYATYYYAHGTLLLYNWNLWRGERADSFGFWWNEKQQTQQDIVAARAHHYRHDVYARAEEICLRVAQLYPDSRVAPLALYRAACCERKLANFNGWWREDNGRHDHYQAASRLMRRLTRLYPHHPLAHAARKYARVFLEEREDPYGWHR